MSDETTIQNVHVGEVPEPRRPAGEERARPEATPRPPSRYWDVTEARWVSCGGPAAG